MLIKPYLKHDKGLRLEAYSHERSELDSVSNVLSRVYKRAQGFKFFPQIEMPSHESFLQYSTIKEDWTGKGIPREGRIYWLVREMVHIFELALMVRFWQADNQQETYTTFLIPRNQHILTVSPSTISIRHSKSFRCKEIALASSGPGCKELVADDLDEARVKCALIAHNNKWLGGVADIGHCP